MKIVNYIGQTALITELNEVFQAYKNETEKKNPFNWRPFNFTGWTGSGKTTLAKVVGRVISEGTEMNVHFLTPNAGLRDIYEVFSKLVSVDENGNVSAIPGIVIVDEAHAQKQLLPLFLTLTGDDKTVETIWRQGRCLHFNPYSHLWIFASNRSVDKALARRCRNLSVTENTPSEMKRLASLMIEKGEGIQLTDCALEALVERLKPFPGDLKEVISPLVMKAKAGKLKKLTGEIVSETLKSKGFFKGGLRKPDIAIIKELAKGKPLTASVLRFDCQDDKKRDTQERIDWLAAQKLVMPVRNGFALSKLGIEYAKELSAKQKAAKAAKASK